MQDLGVLRGLLLGICYMGILIACLALQGSGYAGDSTVAFLYPTWASLLDPPNWAAQQAIGHATDYGPPGLVGYETCY